MPPSGRGHAPQSRTATVAARPVGIGAVNRQGKNGFTHGGMDALRAGCCANSTRFYARFTACDSLITRRLLLRIFNLVRRRARRASVSLARVVSNVSIPPAIAIL